MGQEVVTTGQKGFTLVPSSFDDARRIGDYLSKSELVPKDYKGKPENIVVAIAWGQELGLQPLQALQNIAVINGRPSVWGDTALAIVMARPDFEDIIEEIEQGKAEDQYRAVCTIKRKGRSPVVRTFSVEDAKRAGLWSKQGPWTQYPKRMMAMRARSFALRDAFPDGLRGLRTTEEEMDVIDVTPSGEVLPPAGRASVTMPRAKAQDAEPVDVTPKDEPAPAADANGDRPNGAVISAGVIKMLRTKLEALGIPEGNLADAFGVFAIEDIPAIKANEAMAWARAAEKGAQK